MHAPARGERYKRCLQEARGSETTNLQLAKQSSNALTHYGGDDDEEDDDASW